MLVKTWNFDISPLPKFPAKLANSRNTTLHASNGNDLGSKPAQDATRDRSGPEDMVMAVGGTVAVVHHLKL